MRIKIFKSRLKKDEKNDSDLFYAAARILVCIFQSLRILNLNSKSLTLK
ncbi:hypothetical protein CLV57_1492 [Mucilaginibacter auburnensis]|uniref:Uncharacterized protein n=1 Tax=Mucilaginibacter auburnensis TaxID=1457233 RepID=A0A2H9VUK0_9SPHI|nr:hypothetical protein CLV57_1492 [Mucilaginibacter auburnensis]